MNNKPLTATLERTSVPLRVFILNLMQLLGILAIALNHPDAAPMLALFPVAVASKLSMIGLALVAAKPAINLVSDWADNGALDNSYTRAFAAMLIPAVLAGSSLMTTSCANLPFTGSIDTPWGSGSKDALGNVTIKPWPQPTPPVAVPAVLPPQAHKAAGKQQRIVKVMVSASGQIAEQHPWWDVGHATGFTRPVPPEIAAQGIVAKLHYLVLEVPSHWDPAYNPLLEPGEGMPSVGSLHRKNIRLITENPGHGLWEDSQEQ